MADFDLFWRNRDTSNGVTGTALNENNLGRISPSILATEKRYLQASDDSHTSFVYKGETYIKLVDEDGTHRVFGSDDDITFDAAERLDTGDSLTNGTDYYVYMCSATPADGASIVVSLNSTYPDGYDAYTSRKIGGFHTLCADVGTISDHSLSGYVAGDILPGSFWTLKFRPVSNSEGMLYDEGTGKWWSIYLATYDGSELASEYGAEIADGNEEAAYPLHGLNFMEIGGKQGYRLPWQHEFVAAAKGSNEATNISGSSDPGTTGGHTDTDGRRCISDIGLEDCCGVLWQWCNDTAETISRLEYYTTATSTTQPYYRMYTDLDDEDHLDYAQGYGWKDNIRNTSSIDGSTSYGGQYGAQRNVRVGADWDSGSSCGSRAAHWSSAPVRLDSFSGARLVAEPRVC